MRGSPFLGPRYLVQFTRDSETAHVALDERFYDWIRSQAPQFQAFLMDQAITRLNELGDQFLGPGFSRSFYRFTLDYFRAYMDERRNSGRISDRNARPYNPRTHKTYFYHS